MSEHASKRGDLASSRMLRVYKKRFDRATFVAMLLALVKKFTSCIRNCSTKSEGKRVVVFYI